MNNRISIVILLTAVSLVSFSSCTGKKTDKKTETGQPAEATPAPQIGNETLLFLSDLRENGDYVNSQQFPSLIKASIVFEELAGNNHIIDIRSVSEFRTGHIKGAVNKSFEQLPEYFEAAIRPFEFDKIVVVCADGQQASYTTALLRLMGYGNVYAMRWGMSGWNKSFADAAWLKGLSGKFESLLEKTQNDAPAIGTMPVLETGLSEGKEIGAARFKKLFEAGLKDVTITAEEVFANPQNFFVINLERKDKYDDGHIPGAVRYKPDATLGFTDAMSTIPFDKPVVIYCGTGHNSAFASAFLRLFGYDASTLKYGNNSFMYDKMIREREKLSWLPFTVADVNDYPVVK